MPKQRRRLSSLLGATDEEMGKKDDDRKPGPAPTTWAPARIAPRRSARRLAILLAFFGIIYFTYTLIRPTAEFRDYVPNFPTYEPPRSGQPNRVWPPSQSRPQKGGDEAAGQGSSASRDGKTSLSLPALPSTLKEIEQVEKNEESRHVLFASSSLKSAAALLPLACEMGRQGNNYVHYALMSRNDISIRQLKKIHGIDDSCGISFHGMI